MSAEKIFQYGELHCILTGKPMNDAFVNAYNQYTSEIGRAIRQEEVEYLKDQRHRIYYAECMRMKKSLAVG